MSHDDLLPCPFCGGEGKSIKIDFGTYQAGCVSRQYCKPVPFVFGKTEEEAITAWNTRHNERNEPRCDTTGSYCHYGNMAKWPRNCFSCGHSEAEIQGDVLDKILTSAYASLNKEQPENCPHCGGEPFNDAEDIRLGSVAICCSTDGCPIEGVVFTTLESWNLTSHHTAEIAKRDRAIEVLMGAHNRYISDEICDTSIPSDAIDEAQAILGE